MLWALFSILAALIWAGTGIVDKYVLTKWVRRPIVPVMVLGAVGLVASIFVYVLHGFSPLSNLNILLGLAAGTFNISGVTLYFYAAKIEEISRVIPLIYLTSLFVAILAAIFLGEIFTPVKYLGIFLLVLGAIVISSRNFIKLSLGKSFWLMTLCSLFYAFSSVIIKYLLNFADYWTVFSYSRIGTFFLLLPIFYFRLPDLVSTVKEHGRKTLAVMSLNETVALVAVVFTIIAASLGYITLVNALTSVEPFFVLLFAVLLSHFLPRILKEEIEKTTVIAKFVAIVLMFIGVILVTT